MSVPSQTAPPSSEKAALSFPEFWGLSSVNGERPRLLVVGHRGLGKNVKPGVVPEGGLSPQPIIRENTIKSFVAAAESGADFVEFDAQVTKDNEVILFHDDLILSEGEEPKTISELTLEEFRSYGVQAADNSSKKKALVRRPYGSKTSYPWTVPVEDPLCTLAEAFEKVPVSCGFNVEVKFGTHNWGRDADVRRSVDAIIQTVERCAGQRKVYYSTFHPEAAVLLRKLQSDYPVFFLTNGGRPVWDNPAGKLLETAVRAGLGRAGELAMRACRMDAFLTPVYDSRMVFVEDAIAHARRHGLHGIVSEVTALVNKPEYCKAVKDANLQLLTYGNLNNTAETVRFQFERAVDGVIVDHVGAIVEFAQTLSSGEAPKEKSASGK